MNLRTCLLDSGTALFKLRSYELANLFLDSGTALINQVKVLNNSTIVGHIGMP